MLTEATTRTMGLPQATSLVVGTIIGVGIFNLPASWASYGPISLVSMALTTVGAVCLALMFASLSRRMPADGGPYAYARAAFGNLIGFSNAWLYWIPAWAGNAAIATGWVLYVERFVNAGHGTAGTILLTLAGIWVAAAINLRGIRSMGQIQLRTSVVKFLRWRCACSPTSASRSASNESRRAGCRPSASSSRRRCRPSACCSRTSAPGASASSTPWS